MAEIWLAQDRGPDGPRLVVVKRILPGLADRRDLAEMFLDEAQLAAHLDHPNVVKIFEHGELDGDSFIAMELIEGENLRTVVRRAVAAGRPGMPLPLAVKAIADSARGLHHAHSRVDADGRPLGIIHRDVSPQNLLVSYTGRVKVVDFGIAKAATSLTETRTGVLKGKYPYMSPEQVMGRKIDARSDLFSLGVVLWELVCGDRLYRQSTDFLVMQAIVKEPPPPPSTVRDDVPRALDALVVRALAKDPRDRFPSSEAFARALDAFLERSGEAVTEGDLAAFMHELLPDRIAVWEKVLSEAAEADPSQGLLDELAAGGGATPAAGSQLLSSRSGSRSGSKSGSGLGSGPATPPLAEAAPGPERTSATVALRKPAPGAPSSRPPPLPSLPSLSLPDDDLPGTRAAPPPGLPREAPPMDDLETRASVRGGAAAARAPASPPSVEVAPDAGAPAAADAPVDARLAVPPEEVDDASTVAARAAPEAPTAAVPPPAAPAAPEAPGPGDDAGMPLTAPPAEPPAPPKGMLREAPQAKPDRPSFSERRADRKAEKAAAKREKQLARVAARQARRARDPAPPPAAAKAPRRPSKKRAPARVTAGGTEVLRKAATPLVWVGRLAVAAATIGLIIWIAQGVAHDKGLDQHPDKLVDPLVTAVQKLAGVGGPGTLRVDSRPEGATVRVDGQVLGHTPVHQDYAPRADRVRVEITKRGYRTWRGEIVHAKQGIQVDAHLVRRR